MPLPPGAKLHLNFITAEQKLALLKKSAQEKWYSALGRGRRVIYYGSVYKYFANEPTRHVVMIFQTGYLLLLLKKNT